MAKTSKAKTKAKKKRPSKKRVTVTQLKKKLWRIFSEYIRLRDSDKNGMCKCISCDYTGYWKGDNIQAGHFVQQKGHPNTIFDEKNVHAQCARCNGWVEYANYKYGKALEQMYGEEFPMEMIKKGSKPYSFNATWLQARIVEYEKKVEFFKKNKNLKHENRSSNRKARGNKT